MNTIAVTDQFPALRTRWHQVNEAVGAASEHGCRDRGEQLDPARLAELLDLRAQLWLALGAELDGQDDPHTPVYAVACHYAATLDQEHAARVRYAAGLPTLRPRTEVELLHLRESRCVHCGRPWSLDGPRCDQCPRVRWGHPGLDSSGWQVVEAARL